MTKMNKTTHNKLKLNDEIKKKEGKRKYGRDKRLSSQTECSLKTRVG